jgi:TRAP-type transport system periplasmic protein
MLHAAAAAAKAVPNRGRTCPRTNREGNVLKTATMLIGLVAISAAGAVSARTLKMIVSWPESNTMAYMPGAQLKKNIEAQNAGLEVEISGPETVRPFEQIGPTSAGVFDIIYTHPAYHDKAITNATNAMIADMDLIRSSGVFDYMDQYFRKNHNLKLLANVAVGTAGYHCYLREPLSPEGDWKGRKIRGVATYVPVIEALGGTAVNTDMGEVYSAIERGVVDGACAPQSVFLATKHYEVAKYRTEPTFGQLVSYIAINLDTWNSLTDAERAAIDKAAIQTEKDTIRIGNDAITGDLAKLAAAGVQVTRFPDDKYAIVQKAYYDGIWKLVASCCGADNSEALRAMAIKPGLTK